MTYDWIIDGEIGVGSAPVNREDAEALRAAGFRAILDMTESHEPGYRGGVDGVEYENIPTPDLAEDGAGYILPDEVIIEAVRYIRESVAAGRPVYVHCRYGANRSSIIVTAYMCAVRKIRLYETIHTIKERHPEANPNYKQVAALCRFLEKRGAEV